MHWFEKELGVTAGADQTSIRRAYAARLKKCRPDADPAAYQQLRNAYEAAMAAASARDDRAAATTISVEQAPTSDLAAMPESALATPDQLRPSDPAAVPMTAVATPDQPLQLNAATNPIAPPDDDDVDEDEYDDENDWSYPPEDLLGNLRDALDQAYAAPRLDQAQLNELLAAIDGVSIAARAAAAAHALKLTLAHPQAPAVLVVALERCFDWFHDLRLTQHLPIADYKRLKQQVLEAKDRCIRGGLMAADPGAEPDMDPALKRVASTLHGLLVRQQWARSQALVTLMPLAWSEQLLALDQNRLHALGCSKALASWLVEGYLLRCALLVVGTCSLFVDHAQLFPWALTVVVCMTVFAGLGGITPDRHAPAAAARSISDGDRIDLVARLLVASLVWLGTGLFDAYRVYFGRDGPAQWIVMTGASYLAWTVVWPKHEPSRRVLIALHVMAWLVLLRIFGNETSSAIIFAWFWVYGGYIVVSEAAGAYPHRWLDRPPRLALEMLLWPALYLRFARQQGIWATMLVLGACIAVVGASPTAEMNFVAALCLLPALIVATDEASKWLLRTRL